MVSCVVGGAVDEGGFLGILPIVLRCNGKSLRLPEIFPLRVHAM